MDEVLTAASLTHNDPASNSACAAFAQMYVQLIHVAGTQETAHGQSPVLPPEWWLNRYVEVARTIDGDTNYEPRGRKYHDWRGPLWYFVDSIVRERVREDLAPAAGGATGCETTAPAAKHRPRAGTATEACSSWYSGAAVGTLHGEQELPDRWMENLSGQVNGGGDGTVFRLLNELSRAVVV